MSMPAAGEITQLLVAWGEGQESAVETLTPLVYSELRRLAHRYVRGERPDASVNTTALVNEAYLKLVDCSRVQWHDRVHFFAMSAQIMRRILVDLARARRSAKRGAGAPKIDFDVALEVYQARGRDLVALDDALNALAAVDARKARVIELRFFGGLSVEETAEALGVSQDTVLRDWRLARAWLRRELSGVLCDDV
jgi:RNA polymerase sigma-70 factor (ECF subfamily)